MREDWGVIIDRGEQATLVRHPLGYYLVTEPQLGATIAGGYLSEDCARSAFDLVESSEDHGWPDAEIDVWETGLPEMMGVEISQDGQLVGVGLYNGHMRAISGIELPDEILAEVAESIHAETPHNLSGTREGYRWRLFLGEAIEVVKGYGPFIYGSDSELLDTVHDWLEHGVLPNSDWVDAGVFAPVAQIELVRSGLTPSEVGRSMVDLTGNEEHPLGMERIGYLVSNGDLTVDQALQAIRNN